MPNENSVTDQTKNNFRILFPDYILEKQSNFDCNKELLDVCKKVESKYENFAQTPDSVEGDERFFATVGGYQTKQSTPFLNFKEKDGISKYDVSILERLQNEVLMPSFHKFIEDADYKFDNADLLTKSWFVKYDKNSFQELHTHGDTILTQVYFVKVPKDLKFIGTQPYRHEGSLVISNTKTDWNGLRTAYIKPEEGKLVMFPAEYPHYTLPIISNDERYVIVQDIFLKKI